MTSQSNGVSACEERFSKMRGASSPARARRRTSPGPTCVSELHPRPLLLRLPRHCGRSLPRFNISRSPLSRPAWNIAMINPTRTSFRSEAGPPPTSLHSLWKLFISSDVSDIDLRPEAAPVSPEFGRGSRAAPIRSVTLSVPLNNFLSGLAGPAPIGVSVDHTVMIGAEHLGARGRFSKQGLPDAGLRHKRHTEQKIDSPSLSDILAVFGDNFSLVARCFSGDDAVEFRGQLDFFVSGKRVQRRIIGIEHWHVLSDLSRILQAEALQFTVFWS